MAVYRILMNTTVSATVDVEADDYESAVAAALDVTPTICAQCSGRGSDSSLDLSDDWSVESEHYVDGEYVGADDD